MNIIEFPANVCNSVKCFDAKKILGRRWLLHPSNHVKRLAVPIEIKKAPKVLRDVK